MSCLNVQSYVLVCGQSPLIYALFRCECRWRDGGGVWSGGTVAHDSPSWRGVVPETPHIRRSSAWRRQERILMCTTVSVTMVTPAVVSGMGRRVRVSRLRWTRWRGAAVDGSTAVAARCWCRRGIGPGGERRACSGRGGDGGRRGEEHRRCGKTCPIVLYLLIRLAVASSRTRCTAVARNSSHALTLPLSSPCLYYIYFFFCACDRCDILYVHTQSERERERGMWPYQYHVI